MQTWPCAPQTRITQRFGENPASYAKFGLPGHNGVDFALPVGSALYAVDAGVVIETGVDANGYGNYAKIDHPWGESLYAHMSKLLVGRGDGVGAGQRIGLSGSTGNSTGPHLHFGLRVKPYDRTVWGGWTDPTPHLAALSRTTYRTGPYLAGANVGSMVDTLKRWRPSVAVYMNPSRDTLQRIKATTPETRGVA